MNKNLLTAIILCFFFILAYPAKSFGQDCHDLVYYLNDNDRIVINEVLQLLSHNPKQQVLVTGPPGTGKSALAEAIHRRLGVNGKFVVAQSFSTSPELAIALLFGYAKGAFTGAVATMGLVEEARDGVLFIDEVDTLPLIAQENLLTFLQTGVYYSLGSTIKKTATNITIIFATNADLDELVKSGRMRKDFLARIRGIEISLPPLRDRTTDIIPIARLYLEQLNKLNNTSIHATDYAFDLLSYHEWPGNARELSRVVERAYYIAVINNNKTIEHFPIGAETRYYLGVEPERGNPITYGWVFNPVTAPNSIGILEQSLREIQDALTKKNQALKSKEEKILFTSQLQNLFNNLDKIDAFGTNRRWSPDTFISFFIQTAISISTQQKQKQKGQVRIDQNELIKTLHKMGLLETGPTETELLKLANSNVILLENLRKSIPKNELALIVKNFAALYALMTSLNLNFKSLKLVEFKELLEAR